MIRAALFSTRATTGTRTFASRFNQQNFPSNRKGKVSCEHQNHHVYQRIHFSTRVDDGYDMGRNDDTSHKTATAKDEDVADYFERLGVKRTFSVSPDELKTSYKKLMTQYHPDLQQQKRMELPSVDGSPKHDDLDASDITRAYQIVSDPHERALHLLELNGCPLNETDTNLLGTEMLLTIMEIREAIEDAASSSSTSKDGEEDVDNKELKRLYDENRRRIELTCRNLEVAFDDENFESAKHLVAELQYWNRVEETIREKSTQLL